MQTLGLLFHSAYRQKILLVKGRALILNVMVLQHPLHTQCWWLSLLTFSQFHAYKDEDMDLCLKVVTILEQHYPCFPGVKNISLFLLFLLIGGSHPFIAKINSCTCCEYLGHYIWVKDCDDNTCSELALAMNGKEAEHIRRCH